MISPHPNWKASSYDRPIHTTHTITTNTATYGRRWHAATFSRCLRIRWSSQTLVRLVHNNSCELRGTLPTGSVRHTKCHRSLHRI